MKTLNILITGTGGPTPRSFARALKQCGKYANYRLFGTDIHPYAVGLYQNDLFEASYITPRSSEAAYWEFTEELIKKHDIDIAIILPETEARDWSVRQQTHKLPCKALIHDITVVDNVLDKSILTQLLESTGLVPVSVVVEPEQDDWKASIEGKLQFPYWIRSATGSSGLGSYMVKSSEDLERWISINPSVKKFLASEYLPGRNLGCKFLYCDGKLVRGAVGERVNYIMSNIAPSGITGNTSFGRLLNDPKAFAVAQQAMEKVFEVTGGRQHGFFTVDLKEDAEGRAYITEINIRHVAFTSSFALGGANLCEDTIRLLDGDENFDQAFELYGFEEGLIFLRDVDAAPIVMNESQLLK